MIAAIISVCPKSSDPFYIVSYYIKWVTTSCTLSTKPEHQYSSFIQPMNKITANRDLECRNPIYSEPRVKKTYHKTANYIDIFMIK